MKPLDLIKADLYRHTGTVSFWLIVKNLFNNNRSFKYTFWLRLANSNSFFIRMLAKLIHQHLSIKYQIQIPVKTQIGPGIYLGHASSLIINSTAIIGKNCNLSQFTTIGSNHGKAAVIGDNVYIGPNVCLVEAVNIGDYAIIGAGAVVVRNVASNMTAVGNPARLIPNKESGRYILNPK